jgi:hypothetical protein
VASATTAVSSVLDLSGYRELEVFVDNTQGLGFRDLTLVSFAPDGVTTVDQVLLRRAGWGSAPTGSNYAPGRARGYIGSNPPGGTTGIHVLFDSTGAADTAVNSGAIWVEECDSWQAKLVASGATTAGSLFDVRDDATEVATAGPTAALTQAFAWGMIGVNYYGPAAGNATNTVVFGAARRIRVNAGTPGAANTVRSVITCRGRLPGTFALQMTLPTKAKFQVNAASGPTRVWVVGR